MAGMSVGARGEMAVDMGVKSRRQEESSWPGFSWPSTSSASVDEGLKTWMPGTSSAKTRFALLAGHDVKLLKFAREVDLLLRGRHLGVGRLRRVLGRFRRLRIRLGGIG